MMKIGYTEAQIIAEVNKETDINQKEIERVIDSYSKNLVKFIGLGEDKIKLDYLGSFKLKTKSNYDKRPNSDGGRLPSL